MAACQIFLDTDQQTSGATDASFSADADPDANAELRPDAASEDDASLAADVALPDGPVEASTFCTDADALFCADFEGPLDAPYGLDRAGDQTTLVQVSGSQWLQVEMPQQASKDLVAPPTSSVTVAFTFDCEAPKSTGACRRSTPRSRKRGSPASRRSRSSAGAPRPTVGSAFRRCAQRTTVALRVSWLWTRATHAPREQGRDHGLVARRIGHDQLRGSDQDEHRFVEIETSFGGKRILDWLSGEALPRIC